MISTSSFAADYAAATEHCALLDRSERGKLALTGRDAKTFLQGQITNDVLALGPGRGLYAAFLTPKGKMLGDLRVLDAGPELLLDTERPALQSLFNMIRHYSLGHEVELHKRTLECGLLSLLGPDAAQVLDAAGAPDPGAEADPAEHDHRRALIAGAPVRLIRTEVGFDVLCNSERLPEVRRALIAAGAFAIADPAAECLRIERGRPRYGVDLDQTVIPQEAGLNERAVSFTKGCYVGQETVARLFYKGKPNRRLCGLQAAQPLRQGAVLQLDDRELGTVTSTADSPRLGPIALALIRREAELGATVQAGGVPARVVALPFRGTDGALATTPGAATRRTISGVEQGREPS